MSPAAHSTEARVNHAAEIIRELSIPASYGHHSRVVFEDWLELVEASLKMLPAHVMSVIEKERLADDPLDVIELWARMNKKYRPDDFGRFARALHLLLDSTEEDGKTRYRDTLGVIYMDFAHPSDRSGQFFTPWDLCVVMARTTLGGVEEAVLNGLSAAISASPAASAMLVACGVTAEFADVPQEAMEWFFSRVLPLVVEHYKPVTVMDPTVGSGSLLLAAASVLPQWMVRTGLVQFYGQDIDATCVRMCRINCMLYALNRPLRVPVAA